MKIGVVLGSTRISSNTDGVGKYVTSLLSTHFPNLTLETINLRTSPNHPLPLVLEETLPMSHDISTLPNAYVDPSIRAWSKTVLGWDGLIIVSPQYNWGIPAPLKNALDHLYKEFNALPVGIVTLGGRGGGKCADQLKQVIEGGMHMRTVEKMVAISIPGELIRTPAGVTGGEDFLKEHESDILEMVKQLEAMLSEDRFASLKSDKAH